MASANPALIVRVTANIDDLKKNLVEGRLALEHTADQMERLGGGARTAGGILGEAGKAAEDFGTQVVSAADVAQQEFQELPGIFSEMRGGLNDVAEGAGLTVAQLGLLGTATAVVGTAMAAWNIGRSIADFFELDDAISTSVASMMGWGDVAGEEAGAAADVLARASQHAGREITDLSEAMKINAQVAKDHSKELVAAAKAEEDAYKAAVAEQKREHDEFIRGREQRAAAAARADKIMADAMAELSIVGQGWRSVIDEIDGSVVEGIKHYLDAGVSQKTLADAYGLSVIQIRAVIAAMKDEAAAADFAAAAKARQNEIIRQQTAATNELVIAKLKEAQANEAFLATELAAAQAADAAFMNAPSGISKEVFGGGAGVPRPASGVSAGPGSAGAAGFHLKEFSLRAEGGPVMAGQRYIVGEKGPEVLTMGASSGFITPNRNTGGVVVNVYGSVLSTKDELARLVKDAIVEQEQHSGRRL